MLVISTGVLIDGFFFRSKRNDKLPCLAAALNQSILNSRKCGNLGLLPTANELPSSSSNWSPLLPDAYIVLLIGFGGLVLLTAWLPMMLSEAPLSLPMVCVIIGAIVFALPTGLVVPHPSTMLPLVERLTELIVIIALMGAGLKIDRIFAWKSWKMTWRLLAIAMPISIFVFAWLGHTMLGLSTASALLLAAVLAPTDPVLASDVQVGPPKSGEEDETRFSLTSEAGLNDGLAFPFIMCAIAMAEANRTGEPWFLHWLGYDVIWRISIGVGIGVVVGYALGWIVFRIPNRANLSRSGDGFVALGITVIVYGMAETVHGYGFLSVFVAGLALRAAERNHEYHEKLHDFAEQLERLLMMVVLVLFGGAIVGGLLNKLTWLSVAFSLVAILVVRPLAGWLSLFASPVPRSERAAISFFGIRGIGSVYYLAYATQKEAFEQTDLIWSTVALIILISIFLHGVTVTPAMRLIDRRRNVLSALR